MQDTIIKGTGNSRTLCGPPNFLTLYPTYEAFAQAVAQRTLPIDLGPLNPAGCDVVGTGLIKANLLKDATAQLYGKTADATPDDIFAAIRSLITTAGQSGAKFVGGSYTGAGGASKTINIGAKSKIVIVLGFRDQPSIGFLYRGDTKFLSIDQSSSASKIVTAPCSFSGNNLTINYGSYDTSGINYRYIGIGE